ncbi:MAG: exodeoxyribonuclease VII large subunit, partial [Gammaproteobacteria bacterium]|nr:exodeoxyribonuclease VII large subunit [Gammaproteobacteria bacterium]
MISQPDNNNIYSVSSLNRSVAEVLEQTFTWVWVEGEISNLAQPASGHIYFSLKDASA